MAEPEKGILIINWTPVGRSNTTTECGAPELRSKSGLNVGVRYTFFGQIVYCSQFFPRFMVSHAPFREPCPGQPLQPEASEVT